MGRKETLKTAIWTAICTALASTPVAAQIVPDAGTQLRQLEPPSLTLPRKPPPEAEIEPPARPALQPAPDIRFRLKAVRIAGNTVFPDEELQGLLKDLPGRDVGIAELGEAVGRITRHYSQRGYPLATAYLPAQDIQAGVVEIVVLEGRIGNIHLLNRTRVREDVIATYLQPLPGRVIEDAVLERQLLLTYDLAGVTPASAVLVPGEAVGESDLRLKLDPRPLVSGSVELDNYGNYFSGVYQLSAQVTLASPARLGDTLSAAITRGEPGLEYGRVSYQLPLGAQGLRVGAGYSKLYYRLGENFAALGANGEAASATAFAQYPLVRSRRASVYGGLSYESRSLQDRVDAAGTASDKTVRVAVASLSGDFFDSWGGDAASAYALRYGQGELDIHSPLARVIDAATTRTEGDFHKWSLSFARLQSLTERLSGYVSFYGQKAGKNLDSSEKMILGGINGVRAYPQGEAAGDSGYLLTGELRYALNLDTMPGTITLAGFLDTGEVTFLEEPFAALPNRRRLSGGGVGLAWAKINDFALRVAIAHRIGNTAATAGTDTRTRGWLQAIKNF